MKFLWTILSAGITVSIIAFLIRWFLLKTDVMAGYNWTCDGTGCHPNFDIRNRSSSRSYVLGNIAYTKNQGKEILTFDNKSLGGMK